MTPSNQQPSKQPPNDFCLSDLLRPNEPKLFILYGAGRGGRTPTRLPSAAFESAAPARSGIPAWEALCEFNPVSAFAPIRYHAGWMSTTTLPSDPAATSSCAAAISPREKLCGLRSGL